MGQQPAVQSIQRGGTAGFAVYVGQIGRSACGGTSVQLLGESLIVVSWISISPEPVRFSKSRQNRIDFLAGFDELDLDGQMVGDLKDMGGVETVSGAKARNALQARLLRRRRCGRGSREAGVDRNSVMFGSIAQVGS